MLLTVISLIDPPCSIIDDRIIHERIRERITRQEEQIEEVMCHIYVAPG